MPERCFFLQLLRLDKNALARLHLTPTKLDGSAAFSRASAGIEMPFSILNTAHCPALS